MPSGAHAGLQITTVDEALQFMHGLYRFGSVPGLDRILRLLELAGNPHQGMKAVHVAGTNGKGSVTAMISAITSAAGYRAGRYISPYIEQFGERIAINDRMISDHDIITGVQVMASLLERITAQGREHPTEFEVVTALGFWYFARHNVDVLALEVGLGGRLDATNVVSKDDLIAAVITSIGFDHESELGPTLADIAREKAGIIKQGRPVICGVDQPAPRAVIATQCRNSDAPLYVRGKHFTAHQLASCLTGQAFNYEDEYGTLEKLVMPMVGSHQVSNAACALKAIRIMQQAGYSISDEAIRTGLKSISWPARFEVVSTKPPIIVDAAHNADGISKLVQTVTELIGEKVVLITGMLGDKQISDMVKEFAPITSTAIVTAPPSPRAVHPEALAVQFNSLRINTEVHMDIESAVNAALRVSNGDTTIVCAGSSYLAGPVRRCLRRRHITGRS